MTQKTIQQLIRENGQVYHAEPKIQKDGLPVYFGLAVVGEYFLMVDMTKKDELGIVTPGNTYEVIDRKIAELLYAVAMEHAEVVKELERERHRAPLGIPDPWPNAPWNGIPYMSEHHSGFYVIESDREIPPGTPMMTGEEP